MLAQSFLLGQEYIVNTVSAKGFHYIAEAWKCHKKLIPGGSYLSVFEELLPSDSHEVKKLSEYAISVLEALNIKHGPGHLEIMYTKNGPILIEVAARLQGCVDTDATKKALGDSQASLTVSAYTNPRNKEKIRTSISTIKLFISNIHFITIPRHLI